MQETSTTVSGVDSHAHVFLKDLPFTEGRRYAPAYDASLAEYQSLLEAHGMSHGVLIQPSFLGTDNSYLIACLDRYPEQFRGVVVLDPETGLTLMDEYHAKGVVGIRANLIGKSLPDFAGPAWRVMFERMRTLDWHLEVQIEADRLADISHVVLHSGVRLVVDHFGRLDPLLGIQDPGLQSLLNLGKTQNQYAQRVWVKISGAYRVSPREGEMVGGKLTDRRIIIDTAHAAYALLKDAYGTDGLVWGSDWPHTTYENTENFDSACAAFADIVMEPADRHALLVSTPRALFGF